MLELAKFASWMTLWDRQKAIDIRNKLCSELSIPGHKIIVDFGWNIVITQSFLDELFWVLVMDEGKEILDRFSFQNISEKNKSVLRFVISFRLKNKLA